MVEVHLTLVVLTAFAVLYSDHEALAWFRGKKEVLSKKKIETLHVIVSLGLAGIITTGGLMFIDRASYLLQNPTFIAKMCFVLALIVNAFFIGRLGTRATEKAYNNLPTKERLPLLISGAVSGIGWVGAITLGFLL
jgi:hypothetical protein